MEIWLIKYHLRVLDLVVLLIKALYIYFNSPHFRAQLLELLITLIKYIFDLEMNLTPDIQPYYLTTKPILFPSLICKINPV